MYRILIKTQVLILLILGILSSDIQSQDTLVTQDKIQIENSDRSIIINDLIQQEQYLGNVRITHDSIFMFCDSAWVQENRLEALGDVVIIQNDTINAFSDSLYYNVDTKLAKLYGNVVLKNGNKDLFSKVLIYDLENKVATFNDTSTLVSNTMTLSSLRGVYDVESKLAYFYDEVSIIDKDMKLKTDSLRYDSELDRAYFLGPTYITQDNRKIYCEEGFYDAEAGRAFFSGNPKITEDQLVATAESIYYTRDDNTTILEGNGIIIDSTSVTKGDEIIINSETDDIRIIGNGSYTDDEQSISGPEINYNKKTKNINLYGRSRVNHDNGYLDGDTIVYDDLKNEGLALGDVAFLDTVEHRIILSDRLAYNESTKYYKATADKLRPLYKQIVEDDTLFLSADTLLNYNQGDTAKVIQAVGSVKIYKSDFQAVCDSLFYSDVDSIFRLYKDPISWSDTTQIKGDKLSLIMKNDQVSEIIADGNAMIITEDAPEYYNQIKGSAIHSYLDSSELKKMVVKGNAESLYLIKDDEDAYVGPNKTQCSSMIFHFANQELDSINFNTQPSSRMVPINKATEQDLKLENFKWYIDRRPSDKTELRILSRRKAADQHVILEEDEFSSKVNEVLNKDFKKSEKSNKFGGLKKKDK
ncbi:hypothetical protein N9L92_02610 [Saprospiraceae bacterium]|nr:hypothetical protein [Saprospiraceae bacterium]